MRLASPEIAAPFVPDLLSRDGAVWVHEFSDSMAPLVRAGDRLCLVPAAPTDIRRGQLVAISRGDQLVVHRVVSRGVTTVVTKGDGLSCRDAPVPLTAVVGRVAVVETARGRRIDLDGARWRALGRGLALISRASERTSAESLAWKLTRLPAHLAAWWAR